jgi:hypothetical protein
MNSPVTRQNIKNKHDACISTSFGQCLKTNKRAFVHVWRKIAHVRPPQITQRIPYEHSLHTLNSIDVCAIENPPHSTGVFKFWAQKGNIEGHTTTSSQTPALPKSPSNRNINMPSKRHLVVHYYSQGLKSLIESIRSRMIPPNMYETSIG